jgi:hypothetical protein
MRSIPERSSVPCAAPRGASIRRKERQVHSRTSVIAVAALLALPAATASAATNPYGTKPRVEPYGMRPHVDPYGTKPRVDPYGTKPRVDPYGSRHRVSIRLTRHYR